MLPTDLVEARIRRGCVVPRWIDAEDAERLSLAASLIAALEAGLGQTQAEVRATLEELAGSGTEFRFHRGLTKLLLDRCNFETVAPHEPEAVREAVFAAAAEAWTRGEPGGEPGATAETPAEGDAVRFRFDRDAVLSAAASALGEPGDAAAGLERSLYADLKSQQALTAFDPCPPRWLLDRYNVALAQAVLLRASELTVHLRNQTPRRYRALFRKIKFFRLLHRIRRAADGGGYSIHLDGPLSLFRASHRYGVQMASFLPTLLHFEPWRLEARVRWGRARQEREFELASASAPLRPIGKLTGQWQPAEVDVLAGRLEELAGDDWHFARDAELIDLAGEGVLVPDLACEHRASGRRAYLEVLGYWNRGAVASRLELLRRCGPPGLVIAVSKALAAGEEDLDEIASQVYVYTRTPSAPRVLAALERAAGG